jgi:hypothetical protein
MTTAIITASLAFAEFLINAILAKKKKSPNKPVKSTKTIQSRMIRLNDKVYELARASECMRRSDGTYVSLRDGITIDKDVAKQCQINKDLA